MTWRPANPDDPRLVALGDARARAQPRGEVIVEGRIAVGRAIEAGWPVRWVLATEAAAAELPPLPASTEGWLATTDAIRRVAGFRFHRGCIAVAARPDPGDALGRLAAIAGAAPRCTIVLAEALADPLNVGALVRNARALGAAAVALAGGADPFCPRAVRAAVGHGFASPVLQVPSAAAAVAAIRTSAPDARVVAATVRPGATPLPAFDPPPRVVLLLGAEGSGLSADASALADAEVTIPINPAVDSLNVAAASAILLWHLRARR